MKLLDQLAHRRALRLATFEALAGWQDSLDSQERVLFYRARQAYLATERTYQKAVAKWEASRG